MIKYKSIRYESIQFDEAYQISNTGNIRKLTDKGYAEIPKYKSSLGYNYCQLEICTGVTHIFQVDKIMGYTWLPDIVRIPFDRTRKSILHKNGINECDDVENLSWFLEQEEWKLIDNPDIAENMYEVSSFGRIRNINTGKEMSQHNNKGYRVCSLRNRNNGASTRYVHKFVAEAFVPNVNDETIIVNHINGIKKDNYWRNLEWVTISDNIKHAVYFKLEKPLTGSDNSSAIINEDMVKHIWLLLIDDEDELNGRPKTNGSPVIVKRYIDAECPENKVKLNMITSIKSRKCWKWLTDTFPQKAFKNLQSVIDENMVKHIWLLLIDDENELNGRPKTNGSPYAVHMYLKDEGISITRGIINQIRFGISWKSFIATLPQKPFPPLRKLNPTIAKHIWLLLIDDENELNGRPKTNGSPKKVHDYLLEEGLDVNADCIGAIKYKQSWKKITDNI